MAYMTEIEKLEAKLKCMKMVDGTGLKWWEVVKLDEVAGLALDFSGNAGRYTFALGVVEGKPVWPGDTLYMPNGNKWVCSEGDIVSCYTWHPPKPKTVMVELAVDDALEFADHGYLYPHNDRNTRIAEACRKALEAQ